MYQNKNVIIEPIGKEQIERLAKKALIIIPKKAWKYAEAMGVTYNRITIRNQRTRWGSCSSRKNLNFNCLLILMPESVLDYVIIHELCHLKQMNHSKAFWAEVERVYPDYRKPKAWLKENGWKYIEAMKIGLSQH